jgi:hypothetical protein
MPMFGRWRVGIEGIVAGKIHRSLVYALAKSLSFR